MFVEVLVVTDTDTLTFFNSFLGSDANATAYYQAIRVYYSHLIGGVRIFDILFERLVSFCLKQVNQRFQNSFGTDPDLNLMVVLKNYLFITVSNTWQTRRWI